MPIDIFHLPDEIHEHIAESCSVANNVTALSCKAQYVARVGLVDLKALSQTCRRFYQIMVPILYRAVWAKDGQSIEALSRTLLSRPELAIRTQAVHIFYGQGNNKAPDVSFLANLSNLRHLNFHCEDFTNCWEDEDENLEDEDETWEEDENETWKKLWNQAIHPELPGLGPLSCLQSCFFSLQDDNGEFWSIEDAWQLFAHPTLEIISFNYVSTHQISTHDIERKLRSIGISVLRSTPLKELHFFNSDVTPDGLMVLLQYPKNLKVLTISDPHGYPPIEDHDHYSTEDYLQSMSAVISSLEFLWIWQNDSLIFSGPAYGFYNFTSLRVLDVSSGSLFGEFGTIVEESRFETIIAPNIELLIIRCLELGHKEYLLKYAKRQPESCPSLRKIIVDNRGENQADKSTEKWCATLKESGVEVVFERLEPFPTRQLPPPLPNSLRGYIDGNFWRS